MTRSKVLALRAAQYNLSFSSEVSISSANATSTTTRQTTHLERCHHCLNIVPVTSTLQHHIAAMPKCRTMEQAIAEARRSKRAAQRQAEHDSDPSAGEGVPGDDRSEVVQSTPTSAQPTAAEQAPGATQDSTGEPARKRRKVTVETVGDEDAPRAVDPQRAPPSSRPAATASKEQIPASSSKRRNVTIEEVDDEDAPRPVNSPGPSPSNQSPSVAPAARAPVHPRPGPSNTGNSAPRSPSRAPAPPRRPGYREGGGLRRWKGLYVKDFPDPLAGAPISSARAPELDLKAHMKACGDLGDPYYFETAELLMTSGMTDAAKERHIRSTLTPWSNVEQLNNDIDKLLHGPEFQSYQIDIFDGHKVRPQFMVARNVIQGIADILGNQALKKYFVSAPEKHYTSADKKERVYSDMHTAKWWWGQQKRMRGKGAVTIVPTMFSSDKTTLPIMCGGQQVYPLYGTVANVVKNGRSKTSNRAMVLIGFLPVDEFEDIQDDNERRRLKAELVHRAMEIIMRPLKKASEEGVEMWCPDGRLRRVYPMVAAYMADWPEQNLQACTSEGSCPVCSTDWGARGGIARPAPLRNHNETLAAIRAYSVHNDLGELKELHLKPVWPWWGDLPDVNLATCFTPDLLHQLYQGVFKTHVVRWLKHLVGASVLDERFQALPMTEGMRRFAKGVTGVRQWTGRESKEMVSQILPIVLGTVTPEEGQLVRSLVDFIFQAHASSMTDQDIDDLERDLHLFHELKGLLVAKGFYQDESRYNRIPKIHMLSHYTYFIRQLGTPDGYDTEAPERLHIQYAKIPWRASNKVRPLPQMLKYIQRQEAVRIQRTYMDRFLGLEEEDEDEDEDEETIEINAECAGSSAAEDVGEVGCEDVDVSKVPSYPRPRRHIAAKPTKPKMPIKDVARKYGAPELLPAITAFMTNRLGLPEHDVQLAETIKIDVWHKLYLYHQPLAFAPLERLRRDVVRAGVPIPSTDSRRHAGRFWDTALYREQPNRFSSRTGHADGEKHGMQRYRAGRIRAIFTLPGNLQRYYAGHLAYVEAFKAFDSNVSPFSKMWATQPDFDSRNRRRVLVMPVTEIDMACHLPPKFHRLPENLKLASCTDVTSVSPYFWLNHYSNHFIFQLVQHWWRTQPTLPQLQRHIR
ncbi:hypothetical protein FRC12_022574 [Ceratobasidium sp. 428]|nr:hypothetical protein FRC12_022574 [Ceratobasidium sp. 428]